MRNLILGHLNIDLLFLKDRVGNVIFQFPIVLVHSKARFIQDQVQIDLDWHNNLDLDEIPEVEIFAYVNHDYNIVGFATFSGVIPDKKKFLNVVM